MRMDHSKLPNEGWASPSGAVVPGSHHNLAKACQATYWRARLPPPRTSSRALSVRAILRALREAGETKATVHGFRSTFRDWAARRTNVPRDVAEMALAHAIGNRTEAAYRRGELMTKRAAMMDQWARFLLTPPDANVVPIARRRA